MSINNKEVRHRFRCCDEKVLRGCFRHKRARLTLPRRIIVDFFHLNKGHFTAEEVFEKLSRKYPSLGRATVYRTLFSLSIAGVLNRFDFGDGISKYELSEKHDGVKHHHHLVCLGCKTIIEYDDFMEEEKEFFNKIEKTLSSKYNFLIKGHLLYFYGFCNKCKEGG